MNCHQPFFFMSPKPSIFPKIPRICLIHNMDSIFEIINTAAVNNRFDYVRFPIRNGDDLIIAKCSNSVPLDSSI